MPSGEEGTPEYLKCGACDCHHYCHRKEIDDESQTPDDIVESELLGFDELELDRSSTMNFMATIVCDMTKELIYEPSCSNNMESNLHLWEDKVESEQLKFDVI
ncbi:Zinc-finger homeodomain protein 3 [Capsicum baccatum]|uniref:Zinc-finger homeodomain protein 3 n=1 Tax=Capsicum baccatum TaxID=33114 RepID=A0A2G2V3A5_CAPBA|nr:Zinc-finger homeodomain protein 3 [Capsicum baccatum]